MRTRQSVDLIGVMICRRVLIALCLFGCGAPPVSGRISSDDGDIRTPELFEFPGSIGPPYPSRLTLDWEDGVTAPLFTDLASRVDVDDVVFETRPIEPDGPCILGARASSDAGPAPAGDFEEITCLRVRNDAPIARIAELAFSAVPFSADRALLDVSTLAVVGPDDRSVPAQFDVLSRWNGRVDDTTLPIQMLEVSLLVDVSANGTSGYSLRSYASAPTSTDVLAATIDGSAPYSVDTGVARFTIDPTNPALITRIEAKGANGSSRLAVSSAGAGPRLVLPDGTTFDASTPGSVRVDAGTFAIVERGPVKVVVMQKGHFVGTGTRCAFGSRSYERFGYTIAATFVRGSRNVDFEFHFRNECGDADGDDATDQGTTVDEVSWVFPMELQNPTLATGGSGAIAETNASRVAVTQHKGGGDPWKRRATVTAGDATNESAEFFAAPFASATDGDLTASLTLPWMRFREPQAIRIDGNRAIFSFVSERLPIGEARGIWNFARLGIDVASRSLEGRRQTDRYAMERGLLVKTPLPYQNTTAIFSSLGNETAPASLLGTEYSSILATLQNDTVRAGGQWDRAKTYGSQLWPDTQHDQYDIDNATPYANDARNNVWNALGASLFEWFRTGEPKWAWDMGVMAAWLQMYSAYGNIGDQNHGHLNGFALASGGGGEGTWHRTSAGSVDHAYNRSMHLAYYLRPSPVLRDRFLQAGRTVLGRYTIPKSQESRRDGWVGSVWIRRGEVQHYEMLMNCATFVPGSEGAACLSKLHELVDELTVDNLGAGVMCEADIQNDVSCRSPAQFMQNAMHYAFFVRYYRSFPTGHTELRRALVDIARTLYTYGLDKKNDGRSIDTAGSFVARFDCAFGPNRTSVTSCTRVVDGEGNMGVYNPIKVNTFSVLLMAQQLDPVRAPYCELSKTALADPALYRWMREWVRTGAGFWKGANQMLQQVAYVLGAAQTCSD